MRNRKGITLATCVEAMALIFVMFVVISTFVVLNTISIRRKSNFVKLKASATQIGYDLKEKGLVDFVNYYTDVEGKDYQSVVDIDSRIELENDELDFKIIITYEIADNEYLIPANNDTMTLQFKSNNGSKLVLEALFTYNSGDWETTSWLLKI